MICNVCIVIVPAQQSDATLKAEVPPILCKDSANRGQSSLFELPRCRLSYAKVEIICRMAKEKVENISFCRAIMGQLMLVAAPQAGLARWVGAGKAAAKSLIRLVKLFRIMYKYTFRAFRHRTRVSWPSVVCLYARRGGSGGENAHFLTT